MTSSRIELCPQMLDYDRLGMRWYPGIMFFQSSNYRSLAVNTDKLGFRISKDNTGYSSTENYVGLGTKQKISLIIGGSTAFGVGATKDEFSLASLLSLKNESPYLNFGGRAFNSGQEFNLFKNFFSKLPPLKEVIILSGANDIFLTSIKSQSFMQPTFLENKYCSAMESYSLSAKRKIIRALMNSFVDSAIDWGITSPREILTNATKTTLAKIQHHLFFKDRHQDKSLSHVSFNDAAKTLETSLICWSSLSKHLDFTLTFALQPMPSWSKKRLSKEETLIFNNLDINNVSTYNTLKQMDHYEGYKMFSSKLQAICDTLSINYIDTNQHLAKRNISSHWMFVDRVHLTDAGYKLLAETLH